MATHFTYRPFPATNPARAVFANTISHRKVCRVYPKWPEKRRFTVTSLCKHPYELIQFWVEAHCNGKQGSLLMIKFGILYKLAINSQLLHSPRLIPGACYALQRSKSAFNGVVPQAAHFPRSCSRPRFAPLRAPPPPMSFSGWTPLNTPSTELRLEFTLPTGQSFRWREVTPGEFIGVVGRRAVHIRQLSDNVEYCVISRAPGDDASEDAAVIADYFNLSVCLTDLARGWSTADPHFARLAKALPGARMLRQDPVECLFSFICSQNNHISRIHGMVNRLARLYGTPLKAEHDGESFHAFPSLEQLSRATEDELREAGFGYRARYIVAAVDELNRKGGGGAVWLASLREQPFDRAVQALCELPGVGPKVAACVALFSLDKHDSIPVDVHIWQLAGRKYLPELRGKTLTPKLHPVVQAAFVQKFGAYAGWAHNTLFIAELSSMRERVAAANALDDDDSAEEENYSLTTSEASEEGEEYMPISRKGGAQSSEPATPPTDDAAGFKNKKKRQAAMVAARRVKAQLDGPNGNF